MRKEAIKKLLLEAEECIEVLSSIELNAVEDNTINELWNPKVKSAFEHLRTSLDYSTHDIKEVLYEYYKLNSEAIPSGHIYFPYAKNQSDFDRSLNRNLRKIDTYMPDIKALIESLQDFVSGENWLMFFLTETNKMKHFDESNQTRLDTTDVVLGGNMISLPNVTDRKITFTNTSFNGVVVNNDLEVKDGRVVKAPTNVAVKIDNKTVFKFKESNRFIIKTLKRTFSGISKFHDDLYKLIDAHRATLNMAT